MVRTPRLLYPRTSCSIAGRCRDERRWIQRCPFVCFLFSGRAQNPDATCIDKWFPRTLEGLQNRTHGGCIRLRCVRIIGVGRVDHASGGACRSGDSFRLEQIAEAGADSARLEQFCFFRSAREAGDFVPRFLQRIRDSAPNVSSAPVRKTSI